MADLDFYTNPMSRGQTVRWMLEEVGQPYDTEILDYGTTMKAEPYLSVNPMGKVPAIVHNGKVVTEVAAICCYLADAFPQAGLAPAAERPRRLLPLDLLHLGPGRSGVQQQGRGLGADARAPADVRLWQLRPRHRHARKGDLPAGTISPPTVSPPPICSSAPTSISCSQFNLLEPRAGVHRLCAPHDRPRRLSTAPRRSTAS